MDSSPRPQRRFSRWQTTKRTFVLGDVTYKSQSSKSETKKLGAFQNKVKGLANGKEPSAGQLHLDASNVQENTDQSALVTSDKQHKQTARLDKRASGSSSEDRLIEGKQAKRQDGIVANKKIKASSPILPMITGSTDRDAITDDEASLANKIALTNISQNTSAHKSSAPKQLSSVKSNGTVQRTNSELANEAPRRKRVAMDDGEVSDGSATDKENKDKETNADSPSPVKRTRLEEKIQNVSTSVNRRTAHVLDISQRGRITDVSSRDVEEWGSGSGLKRSSLRNRKLLTPAEHLLRIRQYPGSATEFSINCEQRTPFDQNVTREKDSHANETHQKVKKTLTKRANKSAVIGPEISEVESVSPKKRERKYTPQNISANPNKSATDMINKSAVLDHKAGDSLVAIGKTSKQQMKSLARTSKHPRSKSSEVVTSTEFQNVSKTKVNMCVTSALGTSNSNDLQETRISDRSLRDRSLLLSSEQMKQMRQYPISFFYSCRSSRDLNITNSSASDRQDKLGPVSQSDKEVGGRRHKSKSTHLSSTTPLSGPSTKKSFNVTLASDTKKSKMARQGPLNVHSKNIQKKKETGRDMRNSQHQLSSTYMQSSRIDLLTTNANHARGKNSPRNSLPESDDCSSEQQIHSKNRCISGQQMTTRGKGTDSVSESKLRKKAQPFSLPQRPSKQTVITDYEGAAYTKPKNKVSEEDSVFQMQLVSSGTLVEDSWKRPSKLTQRKSTAQLKPSHGAGNATASRTCINETVVLSQKPPRKRKLVEDLEKADRIVSQSDQNVREKGKGQEVLLWCVEGQSRKGSDVTVYDVILEALMDMEEKLSEQAEDDTSERLVKKVMSRFKRNIKPLISKVTKVKELQGDVRKLKSRCGKLMADIAEQQKLKLQYHAEMQASLGPNRDLKLIRISEWMKGYTQLMAAWNNNSS